MPRDANGQLRTQRRCRGTTGGPTAEVRRKGAGPRRPPPSTGQVRESDKVRYVKLASGRSGVGLVRLRPSPAVFMGSWVLRMVSVATGHSSPFLAARVGLWRGRKSASCSGLWLAGAARRLQPPPSVEPAGSAPTSAWSGSSRSPGLWSRGWCTSGIPASVVEASPGRRPASVHASLDVQLRRTSRLPALGSVLPWFSRPAGFRTTVPPESSQSPGLGPTSRAGLIARPESRASRPWDDCAERLQPGPGRRKRPVSVRPARAGLSPAVIRATPAHRRPNRRNRPVTGRQRAGLSARLDSRHHQAPGRLFARYFGQARLVSTARVSGRTARSAERPVRILAKPGSRTTARADGRQARLVATARSRAELRAVLSARAGSSPPPGSRTTARADGRQARLGSDRSRSGQRALGSVRPWFSRRLRTDANSSQPTGLGSTARWAHRPSRSLATARLQDDCARGRRPGPARRKRPVSVRPARAGLSPAVILATPVHRRPNRRKSRADNALGSARQPGTSPPQAPGRLRAPTSARPRIVASARSRAELLAGLSARPGSSPPPDSLDHQAIRRFSSRCSPGPRTRRPRRPRHPELRPPGPPWDGPRPRPAPAPG